MKNSQQSTSSRRKSSRASNDDEKSERRRLRNRVSQQAFRARQTLRVQELEEQLEYLRSPEAARAAQLQAQNNILRDELLECYAKLGSLEISLRQLKDKTARALGIEANQPEPTKSDQTYKVAPEQASTGLSTPSASSHPDGEYEEEITLAQNGTELDSSEVAVDADIFSCSQVSATQFANDHTTIFEELVNPGILEAFSEDCTQEPLISHDQTQIDDDTEHLKKKVEMQCFHQRPLLWNAGPNAYRNILDRIPFLSSSLSGIKKTNSSFSDHIDVVQTCCVNVAVKQPGVLCEITHLAKVVQFMLSAFVKISWPMMGPWHSHTKALDPLKDFMVWRLTNTQKSYLDIVPAYRPTKLQASTKYPSIIDWAPWPSIRDRLILHHSANPGLDKLICEIGNSYVVQADLSELVSCEQSVPGYVGVWDLVRAIDSTAIYTDATVFDCGFESRWEQAWCRSSMESTSPFLQKLGDFSCLAESECSLPARDANALFSSRNLALQAFKLLGMDRGAFGFCLDPVFFERHPELYDSSAGIIATGIRLKPDTHADFPRPRELDLNIAARYQALSIQALQNSQSMLLAGA